MATDKPKAAFLSYSRADSEFALRLAGDLKAAGADVWVDQLDAGSGERWDKAVQDALTDRPCLLVTLSPNAVKSENVMDEIGFALDQRKTIIPLLYRPCDIPFRLSRVLNIDFTTDYDRGFQTLVGKLEIKQSSPSISSVLQIRDELPSLKQQLTNAQSIDMSGMSLLGISTRPDILLDRIRHKCKVRLLLLNPENEALMNMIEPFIPGHNIEEHREAIRLSLRYFHRTPEFATSEHVQICLYDKPLAHASLIINRGMPDARLRVEMYMRVTPPDQSPGFYMSREDNGQARWFDIFANDFDAHWENATPFTGISTTVIR